MDRACWNGNHWLGALCVALCLWLVAPAGAQAQNPSCDPPDVLLIVDFSNSMNWGMNGSQNGTPTKLTVLRQAYSQILLSFDKKIRFGLISFTTTVRQPPSSYQGDICSYQQPVINIEVPVGPNTGQRCNSILNAKRADGCTPMLPSLQEALKHYRDTVIPNDTNKSRRRFVVMLTDGVPNTGCPGYKTAADSRACGRYLVQEVLKLRNLQVSGKTYDIKTYVIGFGKITVGSAGNTSLDPQNLNDMANAGGTSKYFQANDFTQLRKALETIANSAGNNPELCNGKDDNCNGQIDENLKQTCQGACGSGTRECKQGKWTDCSSPPTAGTEVCNNQDDDCNGIVDDKLTRPCPNTNNCGQNRTATCQAGKWVGCTGGTLPPEKCDGLDNDCDGQIDEDLTQPCTTQCGTGIQACIQGDWSTCTAPRPSPEICDGKDNDCDGQIDVGATCNGKCVGGKCYRKCSGNECPTGSDCGADGLCIEKTCNPACSADKVCQYGQCVPKDCRKPGGRCRGGEICREGSCVRDACIGVSCGENQFCRDGQCRLSCAKVSCPLGQNCEDGKCIADPCEGKTCPAGQVCYKGICRGASGCPQKACSSTQTCVNGVCVDDLCANVKCPGTNDKCVDGQCFGQDGPIKHDPNDPSKKIPNNNGTNTGDGGTNNGTSDGGTNNGGRVNGGGCICSANSAPSHFPIALFLFALLIPVALRRKS